VKGNFHARFCSRGGGSDSLAYCNRSAARLGVLKPKRRGLAARGARALGFASQMLYKMECG
jgi:hypothetical protein